MRVPELAFFFVEGCVEPGGYHVFDADEAGTRRGGVVKEALADFFVDVAAEVVSFDDAGWVGGVDVEGVEVGAYTFEGCEVLGEGGTGFKNGASGAAF